MKKFLSVVLIVSMLISVTLIGIKAENIDELSVYVASDIHYKPSSSLVKVNENKSLPDSELYAHTNTKSMLTYEADAIIDEFLSRFEESDAKYLLIPGDISEDGYWDEHLAIAQKLREFKNRTGKKIYLIPGNHDIRTSKSKNRLNLSDFLDIYGDIGFDETLARHETSASYTAELDADYRLLAIDACIYRQDGAEIYDDLFNWVKEQAETAIKDNKKVIGMIHHNVLKHFELESIGGNQLCVDDYKNIATQLADWGVKYVFTGHGHANDISTAVSSNGNRIYDVETGSLITYPNAYRVVNFSDEKVDFKTEYIDEIDVSLLPDGFTDEQINLMKTDFVKYSYEYFRAGMRLYAYEVDFLSDKLSSKLDLEEGSAGYKLIKEVIKTLGDALKLPLYDSGTKETDSVQEMAAHAGTELDKVDCVNTLDVAGVLYAAFYAGDENYTVDSPEVKVLLQGLEATLIYALVNLPLSGVNMLVSSIGLEYSIEPSESIYSYASKLGYVKGIAKVIIKEILKPLAGGIINDLSVPADNDVVLEPYGETVKIQGQQVPISIFAVILDVIYKCVSVVLSSVSAILK